MNKKFIVSLLLIFFVFNSSSISSASFKDDNLISSEAKAAVAYMQDHRIMIGYNDLFSPKNVITRGEVAKILTVALELVGPDEVLSTTVETPFKDMKNHWASPYVQKLIEYNPSIINGYTDGTFKPDATLRKDELVKLLVVAFQLKADSMPVYLKDHHNWAKEEIETIAKLGIDVGTNLYFKPDTKINRESVALMVYRVLVPSERISAEKNPAINMNVNTTPKPPTNNTSYSPKYGNHTYASKNKEEYDAVMNKVEQMYNATKGVVNDGWAGMISSQYLPYIAEYEAGARPVGRNDPEFRSERNEALVGISVIYDNFEGKVSTTEYLKVANLGKASAKFLGNAVSADNPSINSAHDLLIKGIRDCDAHAQAASAFFDAHGYSTIVVGKTGHATALVKLSGNYWYNAEDGTVGTAQQWKSAGYTIQVSKPTYGSY